MYLAIHAPMFGTANVDSKPLECPRCPRGKQMGENNWRPAGLFGFVLRLKWYEAWYIRDCYPGQRFICKKCGKPMFINWGLVEPDHLSTWVNSEHCPHRLCRLKYRQLKQTLVASAEHL